jgi:NADPH2:quinone reductase
MPIARLCQLAAAAVSFIAPYAAVVGAEVKVPTMMHAAAFDAPGGPSVLTLHEMPVPKIDANEVLIAVHTASVATWDQDFRQSVAFSKKATLPFILGSDGAGILVAKGSAVKRLNIGDEVYAYCWSNEKGGFYAEYAAVPAKCVTRVPKGMPLDRAGALGASGLTALQGIEKALDVKRGDTLIIHGASGAVGTLAIQIAKQRGAKVLASASGDDGVALALSLGADAAVDGKRGDVVAAAKQFAPNGADTLLALASGESLERLMGTLHSGGRVAFPNGVPTEPKPRSGITITPYDAIDEPEDEQLGRLNRVIEAHSHFQIPIAAEFPLARAADAHERLAAGNVLGKILLRVRPANVRE